MSKKYRPYKNGSEVPNRIGKVRFKSDKPKVGYSALKIYSDKLEFAISAGLVVLIDYDEAFDKLEWLLPSGETVPFGVEIEDQEHDELAKLREENEKLIKALKFESTMRSELTQDMQHHIDLIKKMTERRNKWKSKYEAQEKVLKSLQEKTNTVTLNKLIGIDVQERLIDAIDYDVMCRHMNLIAALLAEEPIKIRVNPETSKIVQEICFACGVGHLYLGDYLNILDSPYLFIDKQNSKYYSITHKYDWFDDAELFFLNRPSKEYWFKIAKFLEVK